MSQRRVSNNQARLFVVATPIGHRDDLSLRAIEVLTQVDLIAAEDTRHSRRLLQYHGINTPMRALHEHNERQILGQIIDQLLEGKSVALISDAGTPLISDPGFPLVRACRRQGIKVAPVPGPSAVLAALSVSGLPADSFCFHGFLARTSEARKKQLETILAAQQTQIFYESAHRIAYSLRDMFEVLGGAREVVVARELTKRHEQIRCRTLGEWMEKLEAGELCLKGEFVVLIAPARAAEASEVPAEAGRVLSLLLEELPLKKAAALASAITGVGKNALYRMGLTVSLDR